MTDPVFPEGMWFKVISQRNGMRPYQYNDLDDCWVAATVNAKQWSDYDELPTITEFRAAAGDPDDGIRDGGGVAADGQLEVTKGALGLWPKCGAETFKSADLGAFKNLLRLHRPVSVAINSAKLPGRLQHGFTGAHQVAYLYDWGNQLWIANPLAEDGSPPQRTYWSEMDPAVTGLYSGGEIRAVSFPAFVPVPVAKPIPEPPVVDTTPFGPADLAAALDEGREAGLQLALQAVYEQMGLRMERIRELNAYVNRTIHPNPTYDEEKRGYPPLLEEYAQLRALNSLRLALTGGTQ